MPYAQARLDAAVRYLLASKTLEPMGRWHGVLQRAAFKWLGS